MKFLSTGLLVAFGSLAFALDVESGAAIQVTSDLASTGCCAALSALGFRNRLVRPQDPSYNDLVDVHWSLAARLEPSCFLLPHNAAEVSKAVKTLVALNQFRSCKFAVRSGGHTLYPGAANIDEGVTIDLSQMNATSYNPSTNTLTILPGARWRDVYHTADAANVNLAGGRAASVGTAGLILGGGNSFYSARTGFVCDSVVDFEVVLADGSIVHANSQTNADLFQVLKGGSMNFGIVTAFEMSTLEGAELWGGVVTYPYSTADQQISAIINFGDNIENDQYGSAITIFLKPSVTNETVVVNAYDYTKPVERPAVYNEFLAIPGNTSDSMRITNMSDITLELEQAVGFRDTFLTLTFKPDERLLKKALDLQDTMFEKLWASNPTGNFNVQTLFQPIPTIFSKHGVERGGNVLGLDRFTENLMLYQLYYAWEGSDQDALFNGLGYEVLDELKTFGDTLGVNNEFVYLDYADIGQNPLKSYGADNVNKLKAAAKKYDPKGIFQTIVPGGFKISNI